MSTEDRTDESLRLTDDDTPEVVQMKLLRRDLRTERRDRRAFERRIRLAVALVALFSALSTAGWLGARASDQSAERRAARDEQDRDERDCRSRQEGREGTRLGIIEGGVASAEALVAVSGSQDDPRAQRLIEQTRVDLTDLLAELLPPIDCHAMAAE